MEDLKSGMSDSKPKYSKKVLDLRRRVDVLTNQRKYEEADNYKAHLAKMEAWEKDRWLKEMRNDLAKKERKLK